MRFIRRYLGRELNRVLDGLADPATRHVVTVHGSTTAADTVDGLVALDGALIPAARMSDYLRSEPVAKCHTVVLDAAGDLVMVYDAYIAVGTHPAAVLEDCEELFGGG